MTDAYDLICHYRGGKKPNANDGPVNASFAQIQQGNDEPVAGTNDETIANMTC